MANSTEERAPLGSPQIDEAYRRAWAAWRSAPAEDRENIAAPVAPVGQNDLLRDIAVSLRKLTGDGDGGTDSYDQILADLDTSASSRQEAMDRNAQQLAKDADTARAAEVKRVEDEQRALSEAVAATTPTPIGGTTAPVTGDTPTPAEAQLAAEADQREADTSEDGGGTTTTTTTAKRTSTRKRSTAKR